MNAKYNHVSLDVYVRTYTRVEVEITKMTGTCRLCLKESAKLSPIFCHKQGREHFFDLYRKIFICCGIDINEYDELSSFICTDCVTKLNAAYDFRLVCQRSNSACCRVQTGTLEHCACLNSNTETEIPKVQKIIKICQSTEIDGKNANKTPEDSQNSERNGNFQVNGKSRINGDDNQVNGLSASSADERRDKAADVSMTDSPNSSKNESKSAEGRIDDKSNKISDVNDDTDNLPYEKRLEMARNKYKDILVLNKLNIPPKTIADLIKLSENSRTGCSKNVNVGNVSGTQQKDADDANSFKDVCSKNSQVENDNNINLSETFGASVADNRKSIDRSAEEQFKNTNEPADVQANFAREVDHNFALQEEIVIAFDEGIQVYEEIAIEVDYNQQVNAIIFHPPNQNSPQSEVEKIDKNIETKVVNAGDELYRIKTDKNNQGAEKSSSLIVDSSIEKPNKYSNKKTPQVQNKINVSLGSKDKSLSSRKRSRSKRLVDVRETNHVLASLRDESKRRKSAKTNRLSLDKTREDDHCYVSQKNEALSSNSIEVRAEVHVGEPNPVPKINVSNVKVQKEVNRKKWQNVYKINGQDKIMENLDQILSLEDEMNIEVAQNIEISPDDAQSVDYTVGIPDDDLQDSSEYTQVPDSNFVAATDHDSKEFVGRKSSDSVARKKRLKSSKLKLSVDAGDDEDKVSDDLPKNGVKKKKRMFRRRTRSQNVVAAKKNIKAAAESKNKIKFLFKRLKSEKKLVAAEESTEDGSTQDEAVIMSKDAGDKSPDVQCQRSRVRQLSSSDENLVDTTDDSKKFEDSKQRNSSPLRQNSGRLKQLQRCKYCKKNFLYSLPFLKHLQLQHGEVMEDMDAQKQEESRINSLLVDQNLYKNCRVILTRIRR